MGMRLKAITPKALPSNPVKAQAQIQTILNGFVVVAQRRMQNYPPWQPWKNPPKTGPHAGGRRTGTYGRGWSSNSEVVRKQYEVTLYNPVTYAVYVGGKKSEQARALAARGWQSIENAAPEILDEMRRLGLLKLVPD